MRSLKQIPWVQLLVEGVAIVLSILLAFWIDAWWQDRQDRMELYETLEAIVTELNAGKEEIQYYRKFSLARKDAIHALLKAAADHNSSLTNVEVERHISELMHFSDPYVLSDGSIRSLLDSERLGNIESARLRKLISDWPLVIGWTQNSLRQDPELVQGSWVGYLEKHGNLTQISQHFSHFPGHPDDKFEYTIQVAGHPVDHAELLRDNEFLNLLAHYLLVQENNQYTYDYLDEMLEETIRLVESELVQ